MTENSERSTEELQLQEWEVLRTRLKDGLEDFEENIKSVTQTIEANKPAIEGMEKWLLATLVAINGGAVITLFKGDGAHLESLRWPLTVFTGGIVLAVLSGLMQLGVWTSLVNLQQAGILLREHTEKILNAKDPRDIPDKTLNKEIKFPNRLSIVGFVVKGLAAILFFYGSLGCFIYGAYCVGTKF
jgi:hypothetical protein